MGYLLVGSVWAGMVIQTLVFFICFLFLVFLIIVPIFYGRNLILFQISAKAWWVCTGWDLTVSTLFHE
jgi:hypothetical protein